MHLAYSFLVYLARAGQLTKQSWKLAKKSDKDTDSKDDNGEDPTQLKATRLRDVTVAYRRNRYNRPIDGPDPLRRQWLIVKSITRHPIVSLFKIEIRGTSKETTTEIYHEKQPVEHN